MTYDYKTELNVFVRENYHQIEYSDGSAAEDNIYQTLLKISDRSTFSEDLKNSIVDWTSEYHFDRKRHLILRPFDIGAHSDVLEVGCGCGAITRHLGEAGAKVEAVEGTLNRAKIAGLRCGDLPNVKVFVDDFMKFDTAKKYDFILFIGVLEYAPKYDESESPVVSYLKKAKTFLKDNGKILVAIENAMGLKYLNWCGEDHLGKRFVELNGLYERRGVKTYGRIEWIDMLREADLSDFRFYFPFPDYKLPTDIITEKALATKGFDVPAIVSRTPSRDYTGVEERLFSEESAFVSIYKNGLLADMSNSFLIVCGNKIESASDLLALSFSVDRVKIYCTMTEFSLIDGNIIVNKSQLLPGEVARPQLNNQVTLHHKLGRDEYVYGKYYFHDLLSAAQRVDCLQSFSKTFAGWVRYIISESSLNGDPSRLESYTIRGDFIDAIPQNILVEDGKFRVIDREWHFGADVPTGWIVFRGLSNSLRDRVLGHELYRAKFSDLMDSILKEADLSYDQSSVLEWFKLENLLSNSVYNRNLCANEHMEGSSFDPVCRRRVEDVLNEYLFYIADLRSKMDASRSMLKY